MIQRERESLCRLDIYHLLFSLKLAGKVVVYLPNDAILDKLLEFLTFLDLFTYTSFHIHKTETKINLI